LNFILIELIQNSNEIGASIASKLKISNPAGFRTLAVDIGNSVPSFGADSAKKSFSI
jgi:hypothetical protein